MLASTCLDARAGRECAQLIFARKKTIDDFVLNRNSHRVPTICRNGWLRAIWSVANVVYKIKSNRYANDFI